MFSFLLATVASLFTWGVIAYVAYCLVVSFLSCLPIRKSREQEENPFDSVEYYGENDAPGPDRVCLLESPVEGLGMRLQLFRSASHTLDIVCHTIHTGPSTAAFFHEIRLAADRGVQVRLLLDGKASSIRPQVGRLMRALASHPNISCKRYNPVHPFKPWKWHYLMHDKFIVVDGQYLLLGGRNIGDKFFAPDSYKGKVSNDRDVIVWKRSLHSGVPSAIDQAADYFARLWTSRETLPLRCRALDMRRRDRILSSLGMQAEGFERDNPAYFLTMLDAFLDRTTKTRKISLIHNPIESHRKTPWIWQQMSRMARNARETVLLQTPYVTANHAILEAFRDVSGSVDFSLLTNSAASTPNFPAFSNYYAKRRKFVETGASIYEFQSNHSIHGKAMVVDNRLGVIGSFNMDDRSMHLDTEIMLVVDGDAFASTLSDAIGAYQSRSLRVAADNRYVVSEGAQPASIPVYKIPLLRFVSVFSIALRSFI